MYGPRTLFKNKIIMSTSHEFTYFLLVSFLLQLLNLCECKPIHSTANPFDILMSKNGPEEDVLAQNTSDTWEKLQLKTVNSDWRNPDTKLQLNILFKDLITLLNEEPPYFFCVPLPFINAILVHLYNELPQQYLPFNAFSDLYIYYINLKRKIEILPTYSEGYFEVNNLHKLLDIINELPRSTLEIYINFPEGYELYLPLLQRLRDIIREDVEEHELPLTVIEFIYDVKQGYVFQGMEMEMNQLRRNCDINEKYEYEPIKMKEDTLSQGFEDKDDTTTTRGYKDEADGTTLVYEDEATTKWGYEENTTRGFEDEATTTMREFEDEATTTTRELEDEATTTTREFEDEATTTTWEFEDEATTTTREFEDEATTTTRGFEDEATTTTRGFEDEATTTTRGFEDEATTTTRGFEDEATTTTRGFEDEATTTTRGFEDEATTTTRGFEDEATTTTRGFEDEATTTTRGFEDEATTTTRGFEDEATTTTRGFEDEATTTTMRCEEDITTTMRYEEDITTKRGYEDEATTREYKSDKDSVEDILVQNTTEILENLRMKRETFDLNDPINLILPNEQHQVHPSTTIGGDMPESLPYEDVLEQNKSDIWDEMRKKFPQIDFDNPIMEEDIIKLADVNKNGSLSVTGGYEDEVTITTEGSEDEITITTEGYKDEVIITTGGYGHETTRKFEDLDTITTEVCEDEITITTEGYEGEVTITTGGKGHETTTRKFEDLDTITERYKDEDPITLGYEDESTIRGENEDKTIITERYDDSFTKSKYDEATTTQRMYEDKVTTIGYEDQDAITTEGYEDGATIIGRNENETITTTREFVTEPTTEQKPIVIGIPDFDKPSGMFDGFFGEIYNKLRIFTNFVIQKYIVIQSKQNRLYSYTE
ncbi:S-antigen protein [Armadillidium vulgare]|nr:S-antigen protein [Armadillidium vulgare]